MKPTESRPTRYLEAYLELTDKTIVDSQWDREVERAFKHRKRGIA